MKVYTRHKNPTFRHPKEMEIILAYLKQNGEIHVSTETIEDLYGDFSCDCFSASWMGLNTEDDFRDRLLEGFADYLDSIDL